MLRRCSSCDCATSGTSLPANQTRGYPSRSGGSGSLLPLRDSCCLVLVSGLSSSPVLPRVRALLDYVRTTAAGDCCTPRSCCESSSMMTSAPLWPRNWRSARYGSQPPRPVLEEKTMLVVALGHRGRREQRCPQHSACTRGQRASTSRATVAPPARISDARCRAYSGARHVPPPIRDLWRRDRAGGG
jgi:hypothetical protein